MILPQIIDLMVLVVDCTKGMQTQTAECLVIGQIVCSNMLVRGRSIGFLFKIDHILDGVKGIFYFEGPGENGLIQLSHSPHTAN